MFVRCELLPIQFSVKKKAEYSALIFTKYALFIVAV
jgi:hypothetical protein